MHDFLISGGGTVYLCIPMNSDAAAHLQMNVSDDAQWVGDSLVVEHRYIVDLILGLQEEGFSVGRRSE